jgi:putative membrane protein
MLDWIVQPGLKRFLQTWLISTMAVLIAVFIVPGIQFRDQSLWTPFVTSLVLGILNAFLRPVMMFLAFPLVLFSLGLFMLVINALVLYLVGLLLGQYFEVDGFWSAFFGALIISIVTTVLNVVTGVNRSKIKVEHRRRNNHDDRQGGGPVIDV